ncbi:GAF domain-containing protein [Thiohalocapsa marina]|uniref:GAF domain-containing protein n=1 Tax=Thiohalocapsa marina TaxID=424902 RepID=UPI0036D90F1F
MRDQPKILDCENEPLANSGLIQPGGALLFMEKGSRQFRYVSANAESLLGEPAADLLGQDGDDWLAGVLPDMGALPTAAGQRLQLTAGVDLGAGDLDVLITTTGSGWLLELEPSVPADQAQQPPSLAAITDTMTTEQLHHVQQQLVDAIRRVIGFERVMLYRFHPDWTGEVIAESAAATAKTYLGLRFPASDIPAIARALYAQTPYRHVPDTRATPIPILSRSGEATALDLTWSDLRSVSPVHVQYLENMGVMSSFSVSIMVDGRLWGLVACHHPSAKTIPLARRDDCRALVSAYVDHFKVYQRSVQQEIHQDLTQSLDRLQAALDAGAPIATAFADQFAPLAQRFAASGAALWVDRDLTLLGDPADREALSALHDWCLREQSDAIAAFDQLPEALLSQLADQQRGFSGFLSIGMRALRHGNALLQLYLLRPEEVSEIAWAGDPEKPLAATPDGLRLSPRDSFDKWVEVRRGFSKPWSDTDRFAAEQLRERLMQLL